MKFKGINLTVDNLLKLIIFLLVSLLVIGFFHFWSLNGGQKAANLAIQNIQQDIDAMKRQAVTIQHNAERNAVQDQEIIKLKSDFLAIKKQLDGNSSHK